MQVEVAVSGRDALGECPLWDEREGVLWWVDIHAPAVKRLDPGRASARVFAVPEPVGSIALRAGGGLLAALQSGIFTPMGPAGSLYRLSPGGSCQRVRNAISVPNGIAWSPDGRTMYFADSPRDTIWRYDYAPQEGEASNERVFAHVERGHPVGSCIDAEGCLWNAQYGGSRVVRYTPEGRVDRIIELPVSRPTCCAFGGPRLDTLYITSASQGLSEEKLARQPLAGSLFAVRPGVYGLPEARFDG